MLGIFDSGIGGLSILKVLKEKAPHIDVVYLGDIKNAPYGIKTQDELKKLTIDGVKILLENGATDILSACNSISAFMIIDDLKNLSEKSFRVTEMIKPTIEKFSKERKWVLSTHKNPKLSVGRGKIAVFATPATTEAGAYQKGFKEKGINIEAFAIPELAGAIEFGAKDEKIEKIINRAVLKSSKEDFKTALLCCTHYPFVKDKFEKAFEKHGKKVEIFDPAETVVEKTIQKFNVPEFDSGTLKRGKIKFLISQDSPTFRKKVKELFSDFEYSIEIL